MRQIGPLFGVSHSAAHRVIDTVGPLLALAPVRKRRIDQVTIVDGTLIPTRDHHIAAPSKNCRYSTNVQVAIDADARLVIATGDPQPVEHAIGQMKTWKILRDYRRAASTLTDAMSGIAFLRNVAFLG